MNTVTNLKSWTISLGCSALLALGLLVATLPAAHAQDNAVSKQAITLVVPFPPGAGADATARIVSEKLATELGQRVLVDNKPGADGNIAIQHVAQAKPDGLTLLLVNPTVVYNHLITPLDFDALTALDPLAKVTEYSLVLLMSGSRSPANLPEFMAWAKSKPGGINCGGGGGAPTIACQMLKNYGDLPVTFVPYKGNAPALRDLMGGHLDVMFDMSNSAAAQVGNSKVVPLATTAEGRAEAPFTQLPVMRRSMPAFKLNSWLGMFAPAGVPAEAMKRLDQAMAKVLSDADLVSRFAEGGLTVKYENPQQFRRSLQTDRKHYEQVFRDLKMGK
jgi:tripartite-type tricarboxylate transporter receptor subunit TctC